MAVRDEIVRQLQIRDSNPDASPVDTGIEPTDVRSKLINAIEAKTTTKRQTTNWDESKPSPQIRMGLVGETVDKLDAMKAANEQSRSDHYSGIIQDQNLGGDFNPDPTLSDPGLAFNMARSRTTEDLMNRFKTKYPEGDIVQTRDPNDEPSILYRRSTDQPWQEFNNSSLPSIAGKVATPQAAASVAAAVATGGSSIPIQAAAQFGGVALSSLIDYGIENAQGTTQTLGEATGQAATEGALTGAVTAAPAVPGAVMKGVQTYKDIRLNDIAARVFRRNVDYGAPYQEASDTLGGIAAPMIGQTSGSKAVRGKFRQTMGTTDIGKEAVEKQKRELQGWLEAKQNANEPLSDEQLARLQELQKDAATEKLANPPQGATASDAGVATQQGIQNYEQTSKQLLDRKIALTDSMAKSDEIKFNAIPVKAVATDIKAGVQGAGKEGASVQISAPSAALQRLMQKIDALHYEVSNHTVPLNAPVDVGGAVPSNKTFSALQQISDLRDQARALTAVGSQQDQIYAARLNEALTNMMENPIGGGPDIIQAIKGIAEDTASREGNLALFKGQLSSATGQRLGLGITKPGNMVQLQFLKDNAPDQFATIQDAFRGDLFSHPEGIPALMRRYRSSPETLNLLMDPEEQKTWINFGLANRRINSSAVTKSLANSYDEVQGPVEMLFGGDFAQASTINNVELSRLVLTSASEAGTTAQESPAAQSFRYAIYKRILTETREKAATPGQMTLNVDKALSMVKDVLDKAPGRLEPVLRQEDIRGLEAFQELLGMIKQSSPGGTMQNQSTISALFSSLKLIRSPEHYAVSAATLWNNERLAQILSNPSANQLFMRAVEAGPTPNGLRMLTGAAALGAKNAWEGPSDEQ